jgi:hypothetical protein
MTRPAECFIEGDFSEFTLAVDDAAQNVTLSKRQPTAAECLQGEVPSHSVPNEQRTRMPAVPLTIFRHLADFSAARNRTKRPATMRVTPDRPIPANESFDGVPEKRVEFRGLRQRPLADPVRFVGNGGSIVAQLRRRCDASSVAIGKRCGYR